MGPMFAPALGAVWASWLSETVVMSGGNAAIVVESIDESSEDDVRVPVVDWGEFIQDKFLGCHWEKAKLVDGFLRQVPFAGENGSQVGAVVRAL